MNMSVCWVVVALLGLGAGCQKKQDAAPATITVRCTSGGAAVLYQGVVYVGSHAPSGTGLGVGYFPHNYFTVAAAPNLDETHQVATFPLPDSLATRDLVVSVALRGITPTTPVTRSGQTFVQAEVLVRGQVRGTVVVADSSRVFNRPFLNRTLVLPYQNL